MYYLHIYNHIYIYICLEALYNPQKFLAWISGSNQAHKAVVVMPMIGLEGLMLECLEFKIGIAFGWTTFLTRFVDMFLLLGG